MKEMGKNNFLNDFFRTWKLNIIARMDILK